MRFSGAVFLELIDRQKKEMSEDLNSKSLDELTALLQKIPATHPLVPITARSLATSTCSTDVLHAVAQHKGIASHFGSLISLSNDNPQWLITQDAILQLFVNLSSSEHFDSELIIIKLCTELRSLESKAEWKSISIVDKCFAILSNSTLRPPEAQKVFDLLGEEILRSFIIRYDQANHDPATPQLMLFPSLLVNLSQSPEFRKFILDEKRHIFQRLIPFVDLRFPVAVRGAIMRLVKNCTFDPGNTLLVSFFTR